MSVPEVFAIAVAGIAAGAINAAVGSGTLITFPMLLAFGYPPVVANVSNTVGLVPGSLSGAHGYRRELAGQRHDLKWFGAASMLGGITGAIALLVLPAAAFKAIVPAFIVVALGLVAFQERLSRALNARRSRNPTHHRHATTLAVYGSGVYGGYFGAAQGILLLAILGLASNDDLQRINALKIVLAMLVNTVSGVIFIVVAHVAWLPAMLIGVGSIVGGQVGASIARRLAPGALRSVIMLVGVSAILQLVLH
jgi:hypothetical protein